MKILIIIFIIFYNIEASQKSIIIDDNLDPTIDKISHSTTSFGLYYTFRYFKKSKFKSTLYSFIIGCGYELYQIYDPFEQEQFRGVSIHDIIYNVSGITFAVFLDNLLSLKKEKGRKVYLKKD